MTGSAQPRSCARRARCLGMVARYGRRSRSSCLPSPAVRSSALRRREMSSLKSPLSLGFFRIGNGDGDGQLLDHLELPRDLGEVQLLTSRLDLDAKAGFLQVLQRVSLAGSSGPVRPGSRGRPGRGRSGSRWRPARRCRTRRAAGLRRMAGRSPRAPRRAGRCGSRARRPAGASPPGPTPGRQRGSRRPRRPRSAGLRSGLPAAPHREGRGPPPARRAGAVPSSGSTGAGISPAIGSLRLDKPVQGGGVGSCVDDDERLPFGGHLGGDVSQRRRRVNPPLVPDSPEPLVQRLRLG